MTVKVRLYHLKPTKRIPNSPYPVLHYPCFFDPALPAIASQAHETFDRHGWQTQWVYRYGPTQAAHYHSTTHECMAVINGSGSIRFGAADLSSKLEENTHGSSYEDGGVTVRVAAGDVFVIPAGVSHKTYDTTPEAEFKLLTPGDGNGIAADDATAAVANLQLDGFTMLGAYPPGFRWDFQTDGTAQEWRMIWGLQTPKQDPVVGDSLEGLCGLWCVDSSPHKAAYEQQ